MAQDLKTVRVGICGLGTVGGGTFNLLKDNSDVVGGRAQAELQVVHVGARRDMPGYDLAGVKVSRDIFDVARDPDVDILVELIGGTTVAKELVEAALASGKHVVTANKALIAEFGNELFALAREHGVSLRFEAAVAGGIPIIKALREGLSGNRIEWLAGIINGTGNFILTEMRDKGRDFADVLAQAQELGYAEADPTFDVEGIDAAHKLAILASIAFGMPLDMDAVYTEGITRLTPEDLDYAAQLGYRIKHLGVARQGDAGVELRVHPTLIPEKRLLANVDGVKNAVLVEGDAVGPTLYYGAGAGAEPTASAVVADIVDIASGRIVPAFGVKTNLLKDKDTLPTDSHVGPCYVRLVVVDRPGVMADITAILRDEEVSLEAVIQRGRDPGAPVAVVITIHETNEAAVSRALAKIEQLDAVKEPPRLIRIERFQD